jgi:hypothetical protein
VLEKAVELLRVGKIVMTALQDGQRREMPAENWRYWTFRTSTLDKNALAVCDVKAYEPVAGWKEFLISREHADLVRTALLGPIGALSPVAGPESEPTLPSEPIPSGAHSGGAVPDRGPEADPSAELIAWHTAWQNANPLASDKKAIEAARQQFGKQNITTRQIIGLRKLPDGSQRTRGPKLGKKYAGPRLN